MHELSGYGPSLSKIWETTRQSPIKMELCKIQISKLDGHDWVQWRYRMTATLNGIEGLMDIVGSRVREPERPVAAAGDVGIAIPREYNRTLEEYERARHCCSSRTTFRIKCLCHHDVRNKLHWLYDSLNKDRLYEDCLVYFTGVCATLEDFE